MGNPDALFGEQGMTDEDRAYAGSRYSEVKAAVLDNPYQGVWGASGNAPFPVYRTTFGQAFAGFLPGGKNDLFKAAAERTVDSRADLRWGADRKGWRRIVHPNAVCLFGTWEIDQPNPFSGYFSPGSRGLVIGRFSTNGKVHRGEKKSFSLVGKIYPTTDEAHVEPLAPATFFTQQDFGNESTVYVNDADLRNAPNTTAIRRGLEALILARQGRIFGAADKVADVRQLHEIAELGKPGDLPSNTPQYTRLKMADGHPRIEGDRLDFRDEVYAQIYDPGDPEPKRTLTFEISVSNEGRSRGFSAFKRVTVENWQTIGRLSFTEGVASYNGDHVLHFHHPHWRNDRNDPATAVRVDGRRVD